MLILSIIVIVALVACLIRAYYLWRGQDQQLAEAGRWARDILARWQKLKAQNLSIHRSNMRLVKRVHNLQVELDAERRLTASLHEGINLYVEAMAYDEQTIKNLTHSVEVLNRELAVAEAQRDDLAVHLLEIKMNGEIIESFTNDMDIDVEVPIDYYLVDGMGSN
jgi:hypothetical protein